MKKKVCLTIFTCFCFVISYAQCDDLLRSARWYKNNGEYAKAVKYYNQLEAQCPNYFTETIRGERNYCKKKMNQPKFPAKQPVLDDQDSSVIVSYDDSLFEARGGFRDIWVTYEDDFFPVINVDWLEVVSQSKVHLLVKCLPNNSPEEREGNVDLVFEDKSGSGSITVTFRQKAGSLTSISSSQNPQEFAETSALKNSRVRVSFEAGTAKPSFENVWKLIGDMEENKNLLLQIEIPWCRNQYSMKLIEQRIQNIIDYFVASGIGTERISSSIVLVDVDEDYHFLVDYQNSEKDKDPRISDHITLINVDEGYRASDSAWLKTEEMLRVGDDFVHPLSDVLSKSKILFDFGKDSPIIYDYHDNIVRTVAILKNNKTLKLVVEGYAPDASNEQDQWGLAQRRANNVREIFILLGLSSEQIEISPMTVNDPQNRQNLTDPNLKEHRAVIYRIIKREETQKQSDEESLSEEDLADIREFSEALSNVKIKFDYDKDNPNIDDFSDKLDRVAAVLNKNHTLKLIVELHIDGSDSEEHDRDLALRRAHKIRDLFIGKGISSDQIDKVVLSDNQRAIIFRIVKR